MLADDRDPGSLSSASSLRVKGEKGKVQEGENPQREIFFEYSHGAVHAWFVMGITNTNA